MYPLNVFRIRSSTSKTPNLVISCMISIVKLNKKVKPIVKNDSFSFVDQIRNKNPRGTNNKILPKVL